MPKSSGFFSVWFWHLFLGLDQTLNADLNILNLLFGQNSKFGILFCTLVLAKLLKTHGNHILILSLNFGQDPKSRTWFLRLRFGQTPKHIVSWALHFALPTLPIPHVQAPWTRRVPGSKP